MASPTKRLLITGPPGIGKTTLMTRVIDKLKRSHPHLRMRGFYTREKRVSGQRSGFEVVTLDGRVEDLASSVPSVVSITWPSVGKYKVDVEGFERIALPELELDREVDLFVIDEVGKMELFSSQFFPAVWQIFNSSVPVLASIPIPKPGRDIPQVAQLRGHEGAAVYTLDRNNRDELCVEVYEHLKNLLG